MTATRQIQFTSQEQLYASRLNAALDEVANLQNDGPGISVRGFMLPADGSDIGPAMRRIRDEGYLATDRRNTIVVPAGNWTVASIDPLGPGNALRLDGFTNFALRGEGRDVTRITAAAGTDMGLFNLLNLTNADFSDFTFDANRQNQSIPNPARPNKHGIRGSNLRQVTFRRINVLNAQAYGIGMQSGEFVDVLIEDVLIDGSGLDGLDFKNPLASNRGVVLHRVECINWGRASATVAKAGIDVRGPGRVIACTTRITSSVGTSTAHSFFRARPDDSGSITYENALVVPTEGEEVIGLTSGATAEVNVVSGTATPDVGGIGLREIVGAFINGENITIGGSPAVCRTYIAPINNGGGGTVFDNCHAIGPTDGVSGIGYQCLDTDITVMGCHAADLRTGIAQQSGGLRATIIAPTIARVEIGIDCRVAGATVYGGTITTATETGIDLVAATNATVHAVHFVDSARGLRRNVASTNTRVLDLRFTNTPIETVNFNYGDQRSTLPKVYNRAGACFSILPSASYAAATALVGGAGGAANSTMYFYPIPIFDRVSVLRLGTVIGTATAGVSGKLALYRDVAGSPAGGTVSNLVAECSGTIDMNTAANSQARANFAAAVMLEPGLYWAALVCNGAARPYTVPVTGPVGEWARFVGVADAGSLFAGTGGVCRVSSTALVDYSAAFPAIGPAVDFAVTSPGSPWLGAWEG